MEEKQKKILEEIGFYDIQESETYQHHPNKSKRTQPQLVTEAQGRDCFQTPNYAVDLLVPFIPKNTTMAWECAAGQLKIVHRLLEVTHLDVIASDIRPYRNIRVHNFLTAPSNSYPGELEIENENVVIITNPPFSLKRKFYSKCREYGVPFALLIPADYSGWIIEACWHDGAEKIIPTRRIDYITPTGLSGDTGHSADFHSMWLTWGFGLGRTETYVELTNEEKKGNI